MTKKYQSLQVGDLAVLQNASYFHELNGMIAEILEQPSDCWAMDLRTMERQRIFAYRVRLIVPLSTELDGERKLRCLPWQLRPIDPPEPEASDNEWATRRQSQPSVVVPRETVEIDGS